MTEAMKALVTSVFNELRVIVEKDPKTPVGTPTISILRQLANEVKKSGADSDLCDVILNSLKVSSGTTISAADAFVIAGQLYELARR